MGSIKNKTKSTDWQSDATDVETLKLSCLMRIADATETMAGHYQRLIDERDRYKRWYEDERKTVQRLQRREQALRGVVTRLRNQLTKYK